MLVENIKERANRRGTNLYRIKDRCHLSNGSIRRWNDSFPSADKLKRVAIFLETTMDELMKGCEDDFRP